MEGVSVLHKNWLAHNDIRPSNVLYCHRKQRYILTSFSYSKVVSDISPVAIQPNTLARTSSKSKKALLERETQKDYLKEDIYNLGLTLLSAFFLCQPIHRKKVAPFLRELLQQYPLLHILKDMLANEEERLSIAQVKAHLASLKSSLNLTPHQEKNAMEEKNEGQVVADRFKKEMVVAEGYKNMGALRLWKKKLS